MPRIEPIPWDELNPEGREAIQAGIDSGAFRIALPLQIMAYADHDRVPDDGDRHPNFPRHLLDGKLLELLRIRSAQLGGCEPCMASRKVEGATEEAVACLTDPSLRQELSDRERLALEYLDLLATDHFRIGDDMYRRLAEHFTTAEIIELGMTSGHMIGSHRFLHTLDVFGESDPVIPYAREQVGAAWAELHPESHSPVEAYTA
ncbi:MAG: carboxymuconolactone decarboxylase family protein [Acidimicrobiales bacterium]